MRNDKRTRVCSATEEGEICNFLSCSRYTDLSSAEERRDTSYFCDIMNPLEVKPHLNGKRCTVTEYAHPVIVSRAWPTKESRGTRMEVRKAEITKSVIK